MRRNGRDSKPRLAHQAARATRRSAIWKITAVAVAFVFAPAMARPIGSPEPHQLAERLADALNAYNRATVANDVAALAALVTDDYVLVNSDASVQDKSSYLADFEVPGFRIEPFEIERPFSKIYGDAALTGGTIHLRWTQAGRRQSRKLRSAHLWVRQHGRWRIGYSQLTRIPE